MKEFIYLILQMIVASLIVWLLIFSVLMLLNSCTYSINMIHSEGSGSDVVDENQRADADIKPSIPVL